MTRKVVKIIRQRFQEEEDGEMMVKPHTFTTRSRQLEMASRKGFVSSCAIKAYQIQLKNY